MINKIMIQKIIVKVIVAYHLYSQAVAAAINLYQNILIKNKISNHKL